MTFQAGSISTNITGNAAPLASTFAKAEGLAQGFAGKLTGILGSLGHAIFNPVTAVVGAVTAGVSVSAAVSKVSAAMEAIDATAKAADRLGLSTQAYASLAHQADLAGVANDELDMSLQHLQKNLADVAHGAGQDAAAAFDRLGLNATDLANMPVDQALGRIGDALQGVTNPADRASLAMDLLGQRGGPKLLALLSGGTAALKDGAAAAAAYGIALSRTDAAKVEQANDAMTNARTVLDGIAQQAAVQVAPVIQDLAERFTAIATAGGGIGPKVTAAFESMSLGIAKAADFVNLLPAGFYGFRAAALQGISDVIGGIDKLGEALVTLLNKLPKVQLEWTTAIKEMQAGLGVEIAADAGKFDAAMAAFNSGANAKTVTAFFDNARAHAEEMAKGVGDATGRAQAAMNSFDPKLAEKFTKDQASVADALQKMRDQVATFNFTPGEKALFDFAGMSGKNIAQLEEFQELTKKFDELAKNKELAESAKKIAEAARLPMEVFTDKIKELADLQDRGLLTAEQFGNAQKVAEGDALKGLNADEPKDTPLATLIRAGSAEAIKFAFETSQRGQKDEIAKRQLDTLKRIEKGIDTTNKKFEFGSSALSA
jgi:hypothetical protein